MPSLSDWDVTCDGDPSDVDGSAWLFRTTLTERPAEPDEEVVLRFGGLATLCDVFLNGEPLFSSASMYASHVVPIRPTGSDELTIRVRPLAETLAAQRKPRARWRAAIAPGGLRFVRTSLLGRAPGLLSGPPVVGPYRPVTVERRRGFAVDSYAVHVDGSTVSVRADVRSLAGPLPGVEVEVGGARAPLATGRVVVPDPDLWWPHAYGTPALYPVTLRVGDAAVDLGRVGFRTIANADPGGLTLEVNGVRVFARGAVWTPCPDADLRASLEQVRDAGLVMLRVPGTMAYESESFHDLCDELGILVWQDLMFANLDYPFADPDFHAAVTAEVAAVATRLARHPSTAVVCGNSEVEQQVAMLGLDPALGRDAFYYDDVPLLLGTARCDAVYVPSAPSGGDLPFRPGAGIANYYGVGGYRRPLSDVRLSRVRFAAECLAFSNVGAGAPDVGVPRDAGAGWDFADVRRHYLDLGYADTGEVMADVMGEWRRAGSGCGGGLVLWWRDLVPGAGWGLLDADGTPKVAYRHLARACQPVAVWLTDEGLSGIDAHVANDRPERLLATLRVALYRDAELLVETAEAGLVVLPHSSVRLGVEEILGRFVDVSYAYRFGPPSHSLVVASLERDGCLLAQAFAFPLGRPDKAESAAALGIRAVRSGSEVTVTTRRYAHGVRLHVPGCAPSDDAFPVEPGGSRVVTLSGAPAAGEVSATNLAGRVPVEVAP